MFIVTRWKAQYDLGNQWVATLGYTGSSGRHLPLQYNLYNKYAPQILSRAFRVQPGSELHRLVRRHGHIQL